MQKNTSDIFSLKWPQDLKVPHDLLEFRNSGGFGESDDSGKLGEYGDSGKSIDSGYFSEPADSGEYGYPGDSVEFGIPADSCESKNLGKSVNYGDFSQFDACCEYTGSEIIWWLWWFFGSGESGGYGKSGIFSDNGNSGEIYESSEFG